MFKGSLTALITPFRGGEIDDRAFQELVDSGQLESNPNAELLPAYNPLVAEVLTRDPAETWDVPH